MKDEIKKLLEAATPGPWRNYEREDIDNSGFYHFISAGRGYFDEETNSSFEIAGIMSKNDAQLIANAPEWLRWQNERIEQLEKALENLSTDLLTESLLKRQRTKNFVSL